MPTQKKDKSQWPELPGITPREGSNTIEEYEMVTQVNGLDAISKQMQVLNAVS